MKARILEQLKHGPIRVVTLCMRLGVEYRNVEKHLRQLRKDGVIRFDKKVGWQISPEPDGCARAQKCDEAGLYADAADREKDRADAADARVRELEAQCAAMREALEEMLRAVHSEYCDAFVVADATRQANAALSGDAGRALLERVEALERVTEAAMAIVGDLPRNAFEYDSLRLELIKRLDALKAKR